MGDASPHETNTAGPTGWPRRPRRSDAELANGVLRGERLALTRLMSAVEAGQGREALQLLYPHTGKAHVVGVTGPPGSGKSTLTARLAREYRSQVKRVGIVAVDPSSPFSGGAILGDRIRMLDLHDDREVFVRSMATRGALGGLARATTEVVSLLDAFGKDVVLLETVGVGQDEVEIARAADTTVVVGVPGLGDDVQAIKAGVLEIADILVVNKADQPLAHLLVNDLRTMLTLGEPRDPAWLPPIVETVATEGRGVADLVGRIAEHAAHLRQSGTWRARRAEAAQRQVQGILEDRLRAQIREVAGREDWARAFDAVAERRVDPYAVSHDLWREVMGQSG